MDPNPLLTKTVKVNGLDWTIAEDSGVYYRMTRDGGTGPHGPITQRTNLAKGLVEKMYAEQNPPSLNPS